MFRSILFVGSVQSSRCSFRGIVLVVLLLWKWVFFAGFLRGVFLCYRDCVSEGGILTKVLAFLSVDR
jgi:hypothetical protein